MHPGARVFVAGHRGLVGSAILRHLQALGYRDLPVRSREELDLRDQHAVDRWFHEARPEYVIIAAAKVGGIQANRLYPAEFLEENLKIQQALIEAAWRVHVKRLLFLGSSCIYPRDCPQPIREEYLLSGPLEPTNRPYAIAKIAGIEMCRAYNRQRGTRFLAAMPTNLYGPGDNFDPETSHVLPALIRKIAEAVEAGSPTVTLWGSGTPRREFMYSDDCAAACAYLLSLPDAAFDALLEPDAPLINIGTGEDLTIRELAGLIAEEIGFEGSFTLDTSKPDGTPRKLLDVSRLQKLGWRHAISLREGIRRTCAAYASLRGQSDAHVRAEIAAG